MSLARRILGNTIAQVFGKVFVALIGLLTVKILTNYLDQTEFGAYTIAYEFLAIFAIGADLGLFTIAVKEMSEDESKIHKIMGNVLSLRTILSILVMVIAVAAAFLIPKYQGTQIPVAVAIGSISVVLSILNGTVSALLQVHLKMHFASLALIVGRLAGFLYLLGVVYIGYTDDTFMGLYQAMVAGVVTNVIMFAITTYYAEKLGKIRYEFDIKFWREVIFKALPYGLALILSTIYFRVDSLLLSLMKDQQEVAVYGLGMKILEIFTIIPLYFMNSVLPTLTRAAKETQATYNRIIQYAFDFLNLISMPMVAGVLVVAYPVIFVMSNADYLSRVSEGFYGSDIALQILIFAMLFSFLNVLFAFILIAVNKQAKLLYINAAMVIFNIVTNIMIIPSWGFRGAAFTSVITELLILILNARVAYTYLPYKINLGNFFKIIFSSIIMGIVVFYFVENFQAALQAKVIIFAIPLGVLVYGTLLIITGALTKDMLKLLLKNKTSVDPNTPRPGDNV